MTLLQLTALHLINALAPVNLTGLAHALGTRLPATSAMVDRLTHAGLVVRTPDPDDRRRAQLILTAEAEPIIGDTDPDTAKRLRAVLIGIDPQTRRHLSTCSSTPCGAPPTSPRHDAGNRVPTAVAVPASYQPRRSQLIDHRGGGSVVWFSKRLAERDW